MLHDNYRKHLFKVKPEIENFIRKSIRKKTKEGNNHTLKTSKLSKSYKWYLRENNKILPSAIKHISAVSG